MNKRGLRLYGILFATACMAGPAQVLAAPVAITVRGEVEFNQISSGQLGQVNVGEQAALTMFVDSDVFVDSMSFPTRGYPIDSFSLDFESTSIGLQVPFPIGETPYFVLRNDDPAVDGFFAATSIDFPIGVPINQTGGFGQFINNFSVTYVGETLASLDLLAAQGTYDFTGLTVFNWTVDDGPFNPLGIVFESLTIEAPQMPVPAVSDWGIAIFMLLLVTAASLVFRGTGRRLTVCAVHG